MPNRAMEFHDSTFDGFEKDGADLTLRFSAAYIHESEGEPGLDAGIGWFQEVRLYLSNAFTSGTMSELPCYLWDGQISLGGESRQMVPVPLEYDGTVHLKLVENGEVDGQIEVSGTYVRMELSGEPKDLESSRESEKPTVDTSPFYRLRDDWRKISIALKIPARRSMSQIACLQ